MAPLVRIRAATIADLPALVAIWVESAQTHAALLPEFYELAQDAIPQAEETIRGELREPELFFAVAEQEGEIIGNVEAELRVQPIFRLARRGYIFNLTVKEGFQGQGVGQLLLEHAIAWLRGRDADLVMINAAEHNAPAQRLYHRRGFTPANTNLFLVL